LGNLGPIFNYAWSRTRRQRMRASGVVLGLVCGLGSMTSALAPATAASLLFDDTRSSCVGTNCSSLRLPGTVGNSTPGLQPANSEPFVVQVHSLPGDCLRLDVVSEDQDLEMVVISPNGTVWRNDDRNGAIDRRPLVKIAGAPNSGWNTVQISHFGGAPLYSNFVLLFGSYTPATNPNCSIPTVPSAVAAAVAK
jgi:hypothetical protein